MRDRTKLFQYQTGRFEKRQAITSGRSLGYCGSDASPVSESPKRTQRSSSLIVHLLCTFHLDLSLLTGTSAVGSKKNTDQNACDATYTFNFLGLKECKVAAIQAARKETSWQFAAVFLYISAAFIACD